MRSKAEVVTITPTLWGLAAEMGGHMWAPLGFVLVIALLLITGKFVFSRPALGAPAMVSTGMAMSLLVTPYGWTYEHALLFVPWLWLFARAFDGRRAIRLWVVVVGVVPWLVFGLAMVRINDSFGFLVPLMTLCLVLWSARGEESSEVSRSHPFHLDTTNQTF